MTLIEKTKLAKNAWDVEVIKYCKVNNVGTLLNDGQNTFWRTFYSDNTMHKFVTMYTEALDTEDKMLTVVY